MYIFGGRTQDGNDLGDLAAFRITSRRWYTFQNMGPSPSPRSGHSMTAYNHQIVVLAGEPSSAPRDPSELGLIYVLDTAKIRYPNDQQIQQTPAGERVPGSRRPSGDKSGIPQSKGIFPRDPSVGSTDGPKRMFSGSRDNVQSPGINGRAQDPSSVNGQMVVAAPGSKLPRAAAAGPPPQQQAPPPRPNGAVPLGTDPRARTPTRDGRGHGHGPPLETTRGTSFDQQDRSPLTQDNPRGLPNRAMSPIINVSSGDRPTPQQQTSRLGNKYNDMEEVEQGPQSNLKPQLVQPTSQIEQQAPQQIPRQLAQQAPSQALHQASQQPSQEDPRQAPQSTYTNAPMIAESPRSYGGQSGGYGSASRPSEEKRRADTETASTLQNLTMELEAAKSRNAWYASELTLARKAGYVQENSQGSMLDEKAITSFGEDEKPLIEALIAMRAELANVQNSVGTRVQAAAQMVAEAEQQRDAAIKEAVFAKAKLAAHGGSQAGTPQLDDTSREISDPDRSLDMGRRLGSALALQTELQSKIDSLTVQIQAEKTARETAEATAEAAQRRVTDLEQNNDPSQLEALRAELHEAQRTGRDASAQRVDAHAKTRLLEVDLQDHKRQLEEASAESKRHTAMFESLREAVTASNAKSDHLETKLEEERSLRDAVQRKLLLLRSEHEERTSELESTSRRLRDAEELADKNANEAQTHRNAVISGLSQLNSKSSDGPSKVVDDERVSVLQQQVQDAKSLVKKYQADADNVAMKLRRAEERIAGLETYQEQTSRENLTVRKQLQDAVRTAQSYQAQHSDVKRQLEIHQRDASAKAVQHSALKDLLDERPSTAASQSRSRDLDSPAGRFGSPEIPRLREIEQKLDESHRAHEETKSAFALREEASEKQYREKLEQLEQDYQSAVSYVKGTEKMLKRMKDELNKAKATNIKLQTEVDKNGNGENKSVESEAPADWENERLSLRREIEEMQESMKGSVSQLEQQMREVRTELSAAQEERDHYRATNEQAQQHFSRTTQRAQADLDHLKSENARLETRATDAEHKVSLLLDQVESSVDNYRRQSSTVHSNGISHTRNTSTTSNYLGGHSHNNSIGADSAFSAGATGERNSLALDSLASELETLRTQWEGTHKTYRLSSQFDFERSPPVAGTGVELSDSLANWRKRLDAEERDKESSRSSTDGAPGAFGAANPRDVAERALSGNKYNGRGGDERHPNVL